MNVPGFVLAVRREALAGALAQRVATAVTACMVAGMCLVVLLTTGRTVATEQAVLRSFDSLDTRTVTLVAEPRAALDSSFLARVAGIDQVSLRDRGSHPARVPGGGENRGSRLPTQHGALILVPEVVAGDEPVTIVVVADDANHVGSVVAALRAVLGVADPSSVSIATSDNVAALRSVVEGELGAQSRQLVLLVFGATAALVSLILFGLVLLRRRDFGRRRALGANARSGGCAGACPDGFRGGLRRSPRVSCWVRHPLAAAGQRPSGAVRRRDRGARRRHCRGGGVAASGGGVTAGSPEGTASSMTSCPVVAGRVPCLTLARGSLALAEYAFGL